MDQRVYKISSSKGEWVVEQDNLIIRASSQPSAIELATTAAKYDNRLGHDARVLLCVAHGEWKIIWCSEDDVQFSDQGQLRPTMTN